MRGVVETYSSDRPVTGFSQSIRDGGGNGLGIVLVDDDVGAAGCATGVAEGDVCGRAGGEEAGRGAGERDLSIDDGGPRLLGGGNTVLIDGDDGGGLRGVGEVSNLAANIDGVGRGAGIDAGGKLASLGLRETAGGEIRAKRQRLRERRSIPGQWRRCS